MWESTSLQVHGKGRELLSQQSIFVDYESSSKKFIKKKKLSFHLLYKPFYTVNIHINFLLYIILYFYMHTLYLYIYIYFLIIYNLLIILVINL